MCYFVPVCHTQLNLIHFHTNGTMITSAQCTMYIQSKTLENVETNINNYNMWWSATSVPRASQPTGNNWPKTGKHGGAWSTGVLKGVLRRGLEPGGSRTSGAQARPRCWNYLCRHRLTRRPDDYITNKDIYKSVTLIRVGYHPLRVELGDKNPSNTQVHT